MTKRYRIFAIPFLRKWLIVRCVANTQATKSGGGVFRTGGRTSEGALPPYPLRYPRRQDQKTRKMILSPDRWLGGRRENAQNCRLPQNLVWLFWSRRVGSRCREGRLSNSGSLPFRGSTAYAAELGFLIASRPTASDSPRIPADRRFCPFQAADAFSRHGLPRSAIYS